MNHLLYCWITQKVKHKSYNKISQGSKMSYAIFKEYNTCRTDVQGEQK